MCGMGFGSDSGCSCSIHATLMYTKKVLTLIIVFECTSLIDSVDTLSVSVMFFIEKYLLTHLF